MWPPSHSLAGSTVLLTGATGFLGSYLADTLVRRGTHLRVLAREPARLDVLRQTHPTLPFATVRGDVTDPEAIRDTVAGVDIVVHAAASVGFGGARAEARMRRVNVGGTALLVDAARDAGVRRFLHVSSIAALGRPAAAGGPLDESTRWTASPLNTAYAQTKHDAEMEVQRGIAEGLDAVLVNPALIFGVGRAGENTMQIVERVANGRAALAPAGGTSVVDVRDVAEGCARVLERSPTGSRCILAGESLPWRAILSTLADAFAVAPPRGILPPAVAHTMGAAAELAARLTWREAAFTREAARLSSRTQYYRADRAREALDLHFRPFAETAAWIAGSTAPERETAR